MTDFRTDATSSRDELIDRIRDVLATDDRVAAAWLTGSLGRGTADRYSDVDIWIVAQPADRDALVTDWPVMAESIAPLVLSRRIIPDPGAVFHHITSTWLRFDVSVTKPTMVAYRSRELVETLVDKAELTEQLATAAPLTTPSPRRVADLVREFFRTLGLLPVVLGRQEDVLAASGAFLLRDQLIRLMIEDTEVADRGGALHLRDLLPADRITELETLPPIVANRDSAIEAHLAVARIFLPLAREMAKSTGTEWPDALETACRQHLQRELQVDLP